jgi:hypothetical protein
MLRKRERYIERLKRTLRAFQQKREIALPEKMSRDSFLKELKAYPKRLFLFAQREKRVHWTDGWLIFDWQKNPPKDPYKAFLIQVSKLNKKEELLKAEGDGWYSLKGLSDRERLDTAKRRRIWI